MKYTLIAISIFILSCQTGNKDLVFQNKKISTFDLIVTTTDSLKINHNNNKGKLFFAIDYECPLCISYSKTINDLYELYKDSIDCYAFLPSIIFSSEKIDLFIKNNNFKIPLIVDTNQILTEFLDARITPECFLLDENLHTKYQGLIDNWVKDFGRKSQHINEKYLQEAIITYLKNDTIQINKTNAIGCIIERLK